MLSSVTPHIKYTSHPLDGTTIITATFIHPPILIKDRKSMTNQWQCFTLIDAFMFHEETILNSLKNNHLPKVSKRSTFDKYNE